MEAPLVLQISTWLIKSTNRSPKDLGLSEDFKSITDRGILATLVRMGYLNRKGLQDYLKARQSYVAAKKSPAAAETTTDTAVSEKVVDTEIVADTGTNPFSPKRKRADRSDTSSAAIGENALNSDSSEDEQTHRIHKAPRQTMQSSGETTEEEVAAALLNLHNHLPTN